VSAALVSAAKVMRCIQFSVVVVVVVVAAAVVAEIQACVSKARRVVCVCGFAGKQHRLEVRYS